MQNKKGYEKLQEKMQVTSKGVPLRTTDSFSAGIGRVKRAWGNMIQVWD